VPRLKIQTPFARMPKSGIHEPDTNIAGGGGE
jgi:hypothetical protein